MTKIPRQRAIDILGVCYAHSGEWRNPIVELLGRRVVDSDVLSDRHLFDTEREARAYVERMARAEAERRLPEMRATLARRSMCWRLWWARNWTALRGREAGVLATHAIISRAIHEYEAILQDGYRAVVRRLPSQMVLPSTALVDTPVWVLDVSRFPRAPIRIEPDFISSIEFSDAPEASPYDLTVRYRLARHRGTFSYDHDDTSTPYLSGPLSEIRAFLSEEAARSALARFAHRVHDMLGRSTPFAIMLPAPDQKPIEMADSTHTVKDLVE